MKKVLVLCGALLALTAPVAMAQIVPGDFGNLDIAWNGCPTTATSTLTTSFLCDDPGGVHVMHGRFNVNTAITNVVAMDFVMEFSADSPTLPPFWSMEPGDCNDLSNGNMILSGVKPTTGCGTSTNPTASWTASPIIGLGWLDSGHGVPPTGPNNARLLGSCVRPSTGINLSAGVNYYGFNLTILEAPSDLIPAPDTGPCSGCAVTTVWVWNWARLGQAGNPAGGHPESALYFLEGPGTFGNVAGTNCDLNPQFCANAPTKARTKTWGQIKALYR